MLAVDTNVLVRLVARDDAEQTRRATQLFRGNHVWIAKTVLLETEWVLRRRYLASAATIEQLFRGLGGIPTVVLEDASAVAQAIEWLVGGMDFADALHLASSVPADRFATFERKLATTARRLGAMPVVSP
jgi:predicted nucleic-acid-binding protein